MKPGYVEVARVEDLPEDQGHLVSVEGKEIVLFKYENRVYALENLCPHQGGPLNEGGLHGPFAMCPWHGWEFDVRTGRADFNPSICVRTYPVRTVSGSVWVKP